MITKEKKLWSLNLFSKIMINRRWVNGKLISWSSDHELCEFKNVYSKMWRDKKSQQDFVDVSVENEFWGIRYLKMGWEIHKI